MVELQQANRRRFHRHQVLWTLVAGMAKCLWVILLIVALNKPAVQAQAQAPTNSSGSSSGKPKNEPSPQGKSVSSSDLKTDLQKASYGIGQRIGKSLKGQGVEVDANILTESLKSALAGQPSLLKEEEIEASMAKIHESVEKKQGEQAAENAKIGAKYLEENKKKPGVITTASGLQYKEVVAGKGGAPTKDSRVKVHYRGTLIDGSEFDSSYKRGQPAEFPVGGVIKGWTEALQLMKPGSKWNLTIPPELGYGSQGTPGIPPNSVLNFEVELISVGK